MTKISDLDKQIVLRYINHLTDPIKYGENATLFWFPGSGMTTILKDLFENRQFLKNSLGKLTDQIKIFQFWGHLVDKKNLEELIKENGFHDSLDLRKNTKDLLDEGYEITFVLGRIDLFKHRDKLEILKFFIKLHSINPRRVHIIFNSMDKPWFLNALDKNPELIALVNRMEIIPVLNNNLLESYLKQRAIEYSFNISEAKLSKIQESFGGIIQLSKEYLRTDGDNTNLELKLRVICNTIPSEYLKVLFGTKEKFSKVNQITQDLKDFGVLNLKVFKTHKNILKINPEEILHNIFTESELKLWKYCKEHAGQVIEKEVVIRLLRPSSDDISLWAIDKALSRFRQKLSKAGIDPTQFKTLKKKGYIWRD